MILFYYQKKYENSTKKYSRFYKVGSKKNLRRNGTFPFKNQKNNLKNLILSKILSLIFSSFLVISDMVDETCTFS